MHPDLNATTQQRNNATTQLRNYATTQEMNNSSMAHGRYQTIRMQTTE